jgi:pyruvate-formate lyase-activating enzyme
VSDAENKRPAISVSQLAGSRYDLLDCKIVPEQAGAEAPVEDPQGFSGYIHSYETMGTVDSPGIRFILFLTGSPLHCQYCHNPDTWRLLNGSRETVEEVTEEIGKYAEFLATLGNVQRVEILPFHKMGEHKLEAMQLEYRLKNTESSSAELIQRVQDHFRQRKLKVF